MPTETYVVSSSGKASIVKDPEAMLDYSFDWTAWLASASSPTDVIASITPTVIGTGLVINSSAHNGSIATIWVSGGVAGETGTLECKILTTGGRTDERSVYLKIRER